jgi:hypothetical protein
MEKRIKQQIVVREKSSCSSNTDRRRDLFDAVPRSGEEVDVIDVPRRVDRQVGLDSGACGFTAR